MSPRAPKKGGASREYPLSSAPCTQGRVSTLRWLAWLRPHAWPASPLNHGVTTKTPCPPPPTTCILHGHILHLNLHLLGVFRRFLLFHPLPPAASFFFLFSSFFFSFLLLSSFFFSFFLLFLSCSDESDDSSLEESPAGGEAR